MKFLFLIASLSTLVTSAYSGECVDSRCFTTNSSHTTEGVIVNHGCAHTGFLGGDGHVRHGSCCTGIKNDKKQCTSLYQCSLSIMVMSDTTGNKAGCVALGNVPGIHQFCKNHVMGLPGAPPSIINKCPETRSVSPVDETVISNEYITCIETEVVVGVAVGSFVLGCFVTWAVITVLTQCRTLRKELRDAQQPNSLRSIGYPRTTNEISTSSVHQRLLSNGSADSYQGSNTCSHQIRHQSGESRNDPGSSCRPFQMRQPLPALPIHEVALQPYYAQPIDSLYTCTSDKDYQSIQGGSEHYAPVGEGGDYTSLKSHKITVVKTADKSKQAAEKDTGNDYCSLESERGSTDENTIYYPVSDSSNRDYSSLMDDGDAEIDHREEPTMDGGRPVNNNNNTANNNIKFHVNDLGGFNAPHLNETSTNSKPAYNSINKNNVQKQSEKLNQPIQTNEQKQPDKINLPDNLTGTVKPNNLKTKFDTSYAGVDFRDYESCNGSLHEYFVLQETQNTK